MYPIEVYGSKMHGGYRWSQTSLLAPLENDSHLTISTPGHARPSNSHAVSPRGSGAGLAAGLRPVLR